MNILFTAVLLAGLVQPLEHNIADPEWLALHLDDPYVLVVEVGASPTVDHPHIPGARFVSIDWLIDRDNWPPDELPPVDQLRRAFENAGVGDEGRIVLYSSNPLYATRAFFTLDYLGQGDRVAILDGGFARWVAEKRPVTSKRLQHLSRTFTPRPDPSRRVMMADVRREAEAGAVLLDARPAKEYHGFDRGQKVTRRGHIPGAECDPWQTNLMRDGSFRDPGELRMKYENLAGLQNEKRVIVYCRTGLEASMPYFVLRSLGYDVALYDGSYTEWSRDRSAPVTKLSTRR